MLKNISAQVKMKIFKSILNIQSFFKVSGKSNGNEKWRWWEILLSILRSYFIIHHYPFTRSLTIDSNSKNLKFGFKSPLGVKNL